MFAYLGVRHHMRKDGSTLSCYLHQIPPYHLNIAAEMWDSTDQAMFLSYFVQFGSAMSILFLAVAHLLQGSMFFCILWLKRVVWNQRLNGYVLHFSSVFEILQMTDNPSRSSVSQIIRPAHLTQQHHIHSHLNQISTTFWFSAST